MEKQSSPYRARTAIGSRLRADQAATQPPHGRAALLAAGLALTLAGCATPEQRVADRENLLAAAGFTIHPANTPERQRLLRSLPPNRFVQRVRADRVAYLYADPLVCGCLYIGDQQAYGRYRQEVFQRRLADEQQMTAQMNADAAWDWGPWGPWGPGFR